MKITAGSLSLFSLLFLLSPHFAQASACCGGAFSVPSLITGDDRAQVTASFIGSNLDASVNGNGVWTKPKGQDVSKIFKLESAVLISDRWQWGLSLPLQSREKSGLAGGSSSGLGDITSIVGYEYLTDWDYHPWRPKGVGFLSLTAPTGKSPYDDTDIALDGGVSVHGRGFWSLGVGSVFTKVIRAWDLNATVEVHKSFERKEANSTYRPGYGRIFSAGAGWNSEKFRLGSAIAWNEEDPIETESTVHFVSDPQRFATASVSASYLLPELWAASFIYSDQTLFGSPLNTTLSKSISLLFQKRWNR